MKIIVKIVQVTIGLDIAKNFFQVHGVDAAGQVVLRRKLSRGEVLRFFEAQPKALVGIEACGTGITGPVRSPGSDMKSSCYRPPTWRPKSSAARQTPPMRRRSARRSRGPTCTPCRSRRPSSRLR